MTQRVAATPLPFLGTPRLLVPMLGMLFPLGMALLLVMTSLPETALLRLMTPVVGMPLRLEMVPLQEMAPRRGMVLLLGKASLLKMMFQLAEAQNHQGWTSLAFRMTPAKH